MLGGCKRNPNNPDVSAVQVHLEVQRFEKSFFAWDTLHPDVSVKQLNAQFPGFTQDFLFNIMGTTPDNAYKDITGFLNSYRSLANDAEKKFADLSGVEKELKTGLQHVKYYFPAYKIPGKLITFIGPVNSYANIITADALAVGLQLYMGKDYPLYLTPQGQELYPLFISRRFEPQYIAVNCIRNIVDDMYPDKSAGRPLVEQMIEAGKRAYLLDRLMPSAQDSVRIGYTKQQLEGCYSSEKQIWVFFVQNNLLYSNDPNATRDYLTDGPNTPAFGTTSPGNIGLFTGRQIVRKWMEEHAKTPLDSLMKMPAGRLFSEAKYKP